MTQYAGDPDYDAKRPKFATGTIPVISIRWFVEATMERSGPRILVPKNAGLPPGTYDGNGEHRWSNLAPETPSATRPFLWRLDVQTDDFSLAVLASLSNASDYILPTGAADAQRLFITEDDGSGEMPQDVSGLHLSGFPEHQLRPSLAELAWLQAHGGVLA